MSHGPLKRLVTVIEPLIWGPFVSGNFLTPLIFPALILIVGIALPLGLLPEDALSYERALALASNPLAVIGVLAILPLALLAGSHHLRFGMIDIGNAEHDGAVAVTLYALWQLGVLFTLIALLRILFD